MDSPCIVFYDPTKFAYLRHFQLVEEDTSVTGSDIIRLRANQDAETSDSVTSRPYKARRSLNKPKLYECMLCKGLKTSFLKLKKYALIKFIYALGMTINDQGETWRKSKKKKKKFQACF